MGGSIVIKTPPPGICLKNVKIAFGHYENIVLLAASEVLHSASEVRTFYFLSKGSTKGVVDASHAEIAAALIVAVAVAVVVVHVVVIRL